MQRIQVVGINEKRFLFFALLLYSLVSAWTWTAVRYDIVKQPTMDEVAMLNATVGVNRIQAASSVTIPEESTADYEPLEDLSSVDYYACCGLGHRLIRMSLAAYVARQHNFSLRSFWGWCGERQPVEVFSYLFRPVPARDVVHVKSRNLVLPFYNEIPGFPALVRRSMMDDLAATGTDDGLGKSDNNTTHQHNDHQYSNNIDSPHHRFSSSSRTDSCQSCPADKVESDLDLYMSLRDRFRQKHFVDDFVRTHFANATVIGIHVRAGNNEGGDFEQKGRGISNPDLWVEHVRALVQDQLLSSRRASITSDQHGNDGIDNPFIVSKPPVIYLATDTPSMVTRFRRQFASINVPVLEIPQRGRRKEGGGVLFGESNKVHNKGDATTDDHEDDRRGEEGSPSNSDGNGDGDEDDSLSCLAGWSDTLTDMMLLSHADVIIAGKPSSFVQTLPMSLAFGKPRDARKSALKNKVYCEVIPQYKRGSHPTNDSAASFGNDIVPEWVEIAPTMQCYDSYADWCCNYSTWIKFRYKGPKGRREKVIAKEFVRFPSTAANNAAHGGAVPNEYKGLRNRTANCLRPRRGRAGGGWKDKCLPHAWRNSTIN